MPQLTAGQTAKVLVTFTLKDGTVVPASPDGQPLEIPVGQPCGFKAIDDSLPTMSVGDTKEMNLAPEEAFGMPDPNLRMEIPREQLGTDEEPQPGMPLQMQNEEGQVMMAIIHEVTPTHIRVDANHPLAGEELDCKIEVVGVA